MTEVDTRVTMQQFHDLCEAELDAAVRRGDATVQARYEAYTTPAGVEIVRFSGGLVVDVDVSDESDEASPETVTFDWTVTPPQVHEHLESGAPHARRTVETARHDEFANAFVKYVTLVP